MALQSAVGAAAPSRVPGRSGQRFPGRSSRRFPPPRSCPQKNDGMDTDGTFLRSMTGPRARLAIAVDASAELRWWSADDRDHQRQSTRVGANRRLRRSPGPGSTPSARPDGAPPNARASLDSAGAASRAFRRTPWSSGAEITSRSSMTTSAACCWQRCRRWKSWLDSPGPASLLRALAHAKAVARQAALLGAMSGAMVGVGRLQRPCTLRISCWMPAVNRGRAPTPPPVPAGDSPENTAWPNRAICLRQWGLETIPRSCRGSSRRGRPPLPFRARLARTRRSLHGQPRNHQAGGSRPTSSCPFSRAERRAIS